MKNSQKGFSTLLSIIIAIMVITIGWYILSQNKHEANTQVQNSATSTAQIKMTRDTMIGTWHSGAGDSGSVVLQLNSVGTFTMKEIYSYVEAGDYPEGYEFPEPTITEGSGKWSVETNNGQSYLSLKFDKDFKYVPDTAELIKQYKGWTQEFVGKNEIRIKLEYQKNDPILGFLYDGYLMEKGK